MKVKIKLKNPRTCIDCPFIVIDSMFAVAICEKGIDLSKAIVHESTGAFWVVRPEECKKKFGE